MIPPVYESVRTLEAWKKACNVCSVRMDTKKGGEGWRLGSARLHSTLGPGESSELEEERGERERGREEEDDG